MCFATSVLYFYLVSKSYIFPPLNLGGRGTSKSTHSTLTLVNPITKYTQMGRIIKSKKKKKKAYAPGTINNQGPFPSSLLPRKHDHTCICTLLPQKQGKKKKKESHLPPLSLYNLVPIPKDSPLLHPCDSLLSISKTPKCSCGGCPLPLSLSLSISALQK